MRFPVLALLGLGLIAKLFGQALPVLPYAGQPFSANEVIVENPTPNVHIPVPMKTIRIYRDSAGRTRVDVSIPPDPIATPFVTILDPVAGILYSLDTQNKIARRFGHSTAVSRQTRPPSDAPSPVAVAIYPGMLPASPGGPTTKSESLGTQVIEGLATDGQRITSSYSPPGNPRGDANENVLDSWYSPELRMTLLQKRSNSLMGDSTIRLENINRAEPDPLLFHVPSDYKIVDQALSRKAADSPPALPPYTLPQLPPPAK